LNSNGQALDEFVTTYYLETVYVEANNNGCSATAAGTIPPTSWHSSFVRMAPFDVAEVLVPADYFDIDSGNYSAVLVDIEIPETAVSGEYTGYVQFYMDSEKVQLPYSIKVHDAVLPADPSIEFVHWLDAAPVNLTTDATVPNWWSEQHWLLLRKTGRVMYSMGERSMMTPLTEGAYPLIKTYHDDNDNYSYDYTGFDRWIEMFNDLGFALFEGTHANYMAPVFSWHITTNQRQTILASGGVDQARLDYLSDFWQSLYGHLCSKGWESMYVQHLMDEPYDVADYNDLHQCFINSMPGIKNIDAINSNISQYSPMVDIHVFNLISIAANQTLVNQRLAAGDGVWLYNCCSPYPPDYPNRHLDLKLTGNRLYPWLTYLYQAQGYLNWGANEYRGANPYTSSIGPLPDGTQNPGHPPGDNWFYYKSEAGLRASMRIIAFREGMQDRTLLQMLSENNSTEADNIMDDIARSATDWEDDPAAYYQARKDILDALDIYY
jgi:hypothetical protein